LSGQADSALLEKALLSRIPAGSEKMNIAAFRRGVEEAEKINFAALPKTVLSEELI
ncbi:MAG: 2-oxoacid:ferredoxin oxidoreductase subunit gamma, partial [Candidatus Electrothrix sp. EH2]|nr:2-oxoacid:ferredoxin oxidoreductase subunit gamma [Candidatus Electrothrix sp. EH2]